MKDLKRKKMEMSNRKSIFFTSDLHLGHVGSINMDNRPFRDLDHMHDVLINNWNSVVPHDGIVYVLGDIGMGSTLYLKPLISQLNGTLVAILGNHDPGVNAVYNMGFDVVLYGAELRIANQRVTMTHCPLRGLYREDITGMHGVLGYENWHGETRHTRYSLRNDGQYHLHGHIHSPNRGRSEKILGKQYDVGVVANSFRPVSIRQIESWISLNEQTQTK